MLKGTAALLFAVMLTGHAFAVSEAVKLACKPDYIAYCNNMVVGSAELRACMKTNALKLSKPCLQALVDNKEVTKADVDDYLARAKKAE
jgi:adenylate kinase